MRRYNSPLDIKYSQNFIKSDKIAGEIVELFAIDPNVLTIEIGPGKGALTKHIIERAEHTVAVEIDVELYYYCKKMLPTANLELINKDFLNYQLPITGPYSVVGNIPFNRTADIFRHCLFAQNPPKVLSMLIQEEAASRLTGVSNGMVNESVFSLHIKPLFETKIIRNIDPRIMTPVPSTSIVAIKITREQPNAWEKSEYEKYKSFITYIFKQHAKIANDSLKSIFTGKQRSLISRLHKIDLNKKRSEIQYKDWLKLYTTFRAKVDIQKQQQVFRATL